MKIESNIGSVMQRVSRLKDRDIPAALKTALHPEQWRELAHKEAERTLLALALPSQREFIREFLQVLTVDVFGTGFSLKMKTPFLGGMTLADYQAAGGVVSPGDLGTNLFEGGLNEFRDLMAEWVAEEKRKDQRDTGKTDDDIGRWLARELLNPDGGHLVRVKDAQGNPQKNAGREVREVFMPYILDYLQRKQSLAQLDAATVDAWLRAVLCAWRGMVRELFPEIFRTALRSQIGELNLGGGR